MVIFSKNSEYRCRMMNNNLFSLITLVFPMIGYVETVAHETIHEQEFMVLSTRYRMTDAPNQPLRRTTKVFIKPPTPYPFMDYFNSSHRAEKWLNGTIDYVFVDNFSEDYKLLLRKCFQVLENRTCIKFQPFRKLIGHRRWGIIRPLRIHSVLERRCVTTIGYNPWGDNRMNLNPKFCKTESSILHLLMHVLGFDHEHVRNDGKFFLKIASFSDVWMIKEYDIFSHQNTYKYMPYNWDSIMHTAPVYPIEKVVRDDQQVEKRGRSRGIESNKRLKRSNLYVERQARPQFKDWFPNSLHELDLNNINRHYKCGEYNFLCKDYADPDVCLHSGLGQRTVIRNARRQVVNIQKYAQCVDKKFAERQCPKICGHCYIFYKNDLQLSSQSAV